MKKNNSKATWLASLKRPVLDDFAKLERAQQTVIKSLKLDDPTYYGDGFTSLAIVYGAFAVANWLTPSVISVIGPKVTMIIGGTLYL